MTNLHLLINDKFTAGFIEVSVQISGVNNVYVIKTGRLIKVLTEDERKNISVNELRKLIKSANCVFLHGAFDGLYLLLLAVTEIKKLYWVLWGGDLYSLHKNQNIKCRIRDFLKKIVFRKVDFVISRVLGDFLLAKPLCKPNVEYLECLMYRSNVCATSYNGYLECSGMRTVLIGNSADPSNNHVDIIKLLMRYKNNEMLRVVCPLSYGSKSYAKTVIKLGRSVFGDRFIPLENFMPIDRYNNILQDVTHAVFAHDRQQAMGNIINLLGAGKKVFLKKFVTTHDMLIGCGLHVYDIDSFSLEPIPLAKASHNANVCRQIFSELRLVEDWRKVYDTTYH